VSYFIRSELVVVLNSCTVPKFLISSILQEKTMGKPFGIFLSLYFPSKPHFRTLGLPIREPDMPISMSQ
jgi:hypothetical protein